MHVNDFASAAVYLMKHWDEGAIVNVGTGKDISIAALADLIRGVVGYDGEIVFDSTKPDGTPRKLLDVMRHAPQAARCHAALLHRLAAIHLA